MTCSEIKDNAIQRKKLRFPLRTSDVVNLQACFPLLPALVHGSPNMQGFLWAETSLAHGQEYIFANQHPPIQLPFSPWVNQSKSGLMPTAWSAQSHSQLPRVDGQQKWPCGFRSPETTVFCCLFLAHSMAPVFQLNGTILVAEFPRTHPPPPRPKKMLCSHVSDIVCKTQKLCLFLRLLSLTHFYCHILLSNSFHRQNGQKQR